MPSPAVLCYGAGIDSTALLLELVSQGNPPDLVLTADTGAERPETYAFLETMRKWMDDRSIENHVVRYAVKRLGSHPPHTGIAENMLVNGCLPSIAFGRHSCSLKYKVAPQDKFVSSWPQALQAWRRGKRVIRYIGYDASPRDSQRYVRSSALSDDRYENHYPLREWGWTRSECALRIEAEGIAVPLKSSCTFCTAMKPEELISLPAYWLRIIVLMEAKARPRLRTVEGLWRKSTKARPGRMTDFIRGQGLLPKRLIEWIERKALLDLVEFQERAAKAALCNRQSMGWWIDDFQRRCEEIA